MFMWILILDKKKFLLLMAAIIGFSLVVTTIPELMVVGGIIVLISFFIYLYLRHKKASAKGKEGSIGLTDFLLYLSKR